ncbi:hypothetical protein F5Y16DRAFT_403905 [Xylariaceae sp. FL0255]|nr:hypothetical protein F5Y16DRAFT_403905 [Xylariaceae sp. FL0255]
MRLSEQGTWTYGHPSTQLFRSLATAIDIGLEILETPAGRRALCGLGHALVLYRKYDRHHRRPRFTGNVINMEQYVDHFLARVRYDFPVVTVEHLGEHVLASTGLGHPTTHLRDFQPKRAGIFSYSLPSMIERSQDLKRKASTWRDGHYFLFSHACSTVHELAHLFTSYFSLGVDFPDTPRALTYRNYGQHGGGEAGRWLEYVFFGGSVEFYKRRSDGPEQAGVPYLIDPDGLYHRVHPDTVIEAVTYPRAYQFPFGVVGPGVTGAQLSNKL